jgi:hypothetical protein
MTFHRRLLPVVTITGSSLMVGCGGGSGGSAGSCGSGGSTCNVVGPGYYEGAVTPQGDSQTPAVAIITETGDGAMSGQDGTYYRFNVGFSGSTLTGNYYGFSPSAGGTQKTSGSISATTTSTGLTGSLTVGSGTTAASFALTSEAAVYKQASALATLMGTWSYTATGFSLTVTIATNGTFTGTDSNNCSYTGSFGIINPVFNAYTETYIRACNGTSLTFSGFAVYLAPSGSANADIKVLADDNASEFLVADLQ